MSEINAGKPRRAKRRVALPAIVAGGVSSLLLAFSLTPTFSALTAAITNSNNTAGIGTLMMEEKSPDSSAGTVTCSSGATGSMANCTLNKYGANMLMKPGDTATTTVTLKNIGTVSAANLTVKGDTCAEKLQSDNSTSSTGLCGLYTITVTPSVPTTGDATVGSAYSGDAASFGTASTTTLATNVKSGGTVQVVITAKLATTAAAANQGRFISQPITFTFNA